MSEHPKTKAPRLVDYEQTEVCDLSRQRYDDFDVDSTQFLAPTADQSFGTYLLFTISPGLLFVSLPIHVPKVTLCSLT